MIKQEMCYAGIGSRETPNEVLVLFSNIAKYLAESGLTLRSGHADGADMAFENGCDIANGRKEIYIPWSNFNGSDSKLVVSERLAYEIAEMFHPYWDNLKAGAKKLQARNTHQVLGIDFKSPSAFIICWTKDGKRVGGTAQAIRIAEHYQVPIYNAGYYSDITEMRHEAKTFLGNFGLV